MPNKISKGDYGVGSPGINISNQNLLDYSDKSGFYTGINVTNEPYSGQYWFYTISGGVHYLWSCVYAQAYLHPGEFYVGHIYDNGGTKAFTGWTKVYNDNDTKIQTVSRAGTGSDSSSNPCSITFSYAPSVVFCLGYTDSSGFWGCDYSNFGSSPGIVTSIISTTFSNMKCFSYYSSQSEGRSSNYVRKSSDSKTIYWYHSFQDAACSQMNESGKTFYFIGFH